MKNRHIGTDIIDADQVIEKTLIARRSVPIKRHAQASAPIVYTAKPGQVVGVVYAWVKDGSTLYWMFYDDKNAPYYAEHKPGLFSVDALQQQGAQTLEDIQQAQQAAENPISTTVQKVLKPVTLAIAAFFIIKAFR
mgnify:CR=1 FL=1